MNSTKIVKQRVQINSCERTDPKSKGNDIDDGEAKNVEVEIVDASSFKSIFLN